MVAALGLLLPFSGQIYIGGLALTTASGALTLAGSLVNLAGAALLNAGVAALGPSPARPENVQVNAKSGTAPRMGHVGTVKAGGNFVFHRAKNGVSYRVLVLGQGEVSEVLGYYLNNVPVSLDVDGWVTDAQYFYRVYPRVRILTRRGVVPETAYGDITAIWPEWTANHRLDGQWSALITAIAPPAQYMRAMFPNGEPELRALARTAKFYDPRSDTTAFTENWALIINGYIGLPDGMGRVNAIDPDDLIAEANLCDVGIPLAAGGTEPRYRLSGSYTLTEKPQAVLRRMLDAGAGRIKLRPNGKIGLRCGVWRAPELTIHFADLAAGGQEVEFGPDKLDRYNILPARYTDPALGYTEVDAEAWRNEARIAADGEELVAQGKSLIMAPSHRQARQVMSIMEARENPPMTCSLLLKPHMLAAQFEDEVAVNIPELGLVGVAEVESPSVAFEKGLLRSVSVKLRFIDPAAFARGLDQQGVPQELPEPDVPSGVPIPEDVVAAPAGLEASATTLLPGIGVAWSAAPSAALQAVVRYSLTGLNQWQDFPVPTDAVNAVIAGPLVGGTSYDVAVHFLTPGGVLGEPAIVTGVVAEAATTPPPPPQTLTVTDMTGGQAQIGVTTADVAGLWKTEIYRDAVLIAFSYAGDNTAFDIVDSSGAGTFDWTARSINVSAKPSTLLGPVTETIT